jgi:hypothetical protein
MENSTLLMVCAWTPPADEQGQIAEKKEVKVAVAAASDELKFAFIGGEC